jgi:hypothetical protein
MRTTLITSFGLAVLVCSFCFILTGKASESETVSSNAPAASSSGKGTPVIQFETTFFDFGRITALGTVSGVFKFKNAGDGVLKIEPPKPSCGCTDAKVTPDTLAPGESGEITYKINLDHPTGQVQKHIAIYSNDPKTPDVDLVMQMDCTPLYELAPAVLRILLPPDKTEVQASFTITRNDGKPAGIERLTSSQKWVSAALDSSVKPEASADKVNVTVHRPTAPATKIVANIQLWANGQTNEPVETLLTWCEIQGQLTVTPAQIYWVIPNYGSSITNYPADSLTHTLKLKSVGDQPVQIKNVTSSIKGMSTQVVSTDAGKTFDLVLKFDALPSEFTNGIVTVETASTSLPKLQVPVTVAVSQ